MSSRYTWPFGIPNGNRTINKLRNAFKMNTMINNVGMKILLIVYQKIEL